MAFERGLQIQIELKRQGKTQSWLLQALNEQGFPGLDNPLLSRILTGAYPWGMAPAVIAKANEILGVKGNTGDAESA